MDPRRVLTQKDLVRFFEFGRSRFGQPVGEVKKAALSKNAGYHMARRPDMLRPQVPTRHIDAADAAIQEIRASTSAAREAYRQACLTQRKGEARDFVRQALASGLTTFENSRLKMVERGAAVDYMSLTAQAPESEGKPHRQSWLARLLGRRPR